MPYWHATTALADPSPGRKNMPSLPEPIQLDPSRVPEQLRKWIPLAERWGGSDDVVGDYIVDAATAKSWTNCWRCGMRTNRTGTRCTHGWGSRSQIEGTSHQGVCRVHLPHDGSRLSHGHSKTRRSPRRLSNSVTPPLSATVNAIGTDGSLKVQTFSGGGGGYNVPAGNSRVRCSGTQEPCRRR